MRVMELTADKGVTDQPVAGPASLDFAVVVIGRNEGMRLLNCLTSLGPMIWRTVYVDSGSSDNSAVEAALLNARVISLDMRQPFTAARARNEGYRRALQSWPEVKFLQFVDGDCLMNAYWLRKARDFMQQRGDVAAVFGRRREQHGDQSIYNRLCDREWSGLPGSVLECGGDVFVRVDALKQAGGYSASLIAGEEPDLCVRLRALGWNVWRLDVEMTLHDAAMTRMSQWWRRNLRAGHAYAEVATLHWSSPQGIWRRSLLRALSWGALLPIASASLATAHPIGLALLFAYPFQIARLAVREGGTRPSSESWCRAMLDVFGKFAECKGAITYFANCVVGRRQRIIEYK
jgi:GT2 family glycosyltransferase